MDIFESDKQAAVERQSVDWMTRFAIEKLGAPEGWRWFKAEAKNHATPKSAFVLITGAVCTAKIERGKRKGAEDWKRRDKSTEATYAIRSAELDAFQEEWSARTGLCHECFGTGERLYGWSATEGNRYIPCKSCGATGAADRPQQVCAVT